MPGISLKKTVNAELLDYSSVKPFTVVGYLHNKAAGYQIPITYHATGCTIFFSGKETDYNIQH